jgi:hydrogenase-4 component H
MPRTPIRAREEVCPVGSIKLSNEYELASTDKNDFKLAAVLKMAKCNECGTPFMTKRMLTKLRDEFSPAWLQTKEEPPQWFSICPSCRKRKESGMLKEGTQIG